VNDDHTHRGAVDQPRRLRPRRAFDEGLCEAVDWYARQRAWVASVGSADSEPCDIQVPSFPVLDPELVLAEFRSPPVWVAGLALHAGPNARHTSAGVLWPATLVAKPAAKLSP
jgi:hypothetical protein